MRIRRGTFRSLIISCVPFASSLITSGRESAIDFDVASNGGSSTENGAQVKSLIEDTIQARFWDLSKAGASVDVAASPSPRERVVLVLDGQLSMSADGATRSIDREMMVDGSRPPKHVIIRGFGGLPRALVVVFAAVNG